MALRATKPRPADGDTGWPGGFPELFAETAARFAQRTALVDGDRSLTFAEWYSHSEALAAALASRGVGRGDVVSYQLPNWWEAAAVFCATVRLGAITNPILPIFRERELSFVLQQSRAKVLFVPANFRGVDYPALIESLRDGLPDLAHVVEVRGSGGFAELIATDASAPTVAIDPDDLFLLMYTSGTTADPKGVLHTHRTLITEIRSLERVHQLSDTDSTLMPSPLTHISGVLHAIMTPAMVGTHAVLMDRWDADHGSELIDRHQLTYMVGAPIFLQELIAAHRPEKSSSLRLFSCGGADVAPALMREARQTLGCLAKRVYGSTEFPTMTTTTADDATSHGITTEGRPIEPNRIRIVDEDGNAVADGEQGEIQAIGPELFVGYAEAHLNDDCFTEDGWFRTGDLGSIDGDGYLTVSGRLKLIIIRKGEKISIREVEELICAHPKISDACLVGIRDDEVGERACAAIISREPAPTREELLSYLKERGLAHQKLPERIIFVDALPRTDSGKVHRPGVAALFDAS